MADSIGLGSFSLNSRTKGIEVKSESVSPLVMSYSVTPRTIVHQAPLSMDFSRQKYQNG